MTRKTSLVVTVVTIATALVFAAPALGKGQPVEQQWQKALQARSEGLNRMYGLGSESQYFEALVLRSQALNAKHGIEAYPTSTMLIEQAKRNPLPARVDQSTVALDAREESFGAKREAQLGSAQSPDVVQRAIEAHTRSIREPVVDDRFRIEPTNGPAPVSVTTTGREVEWPQIGIGFGIGLLLAAGMFVALRLTRTRQLAH